MVRWLQHPRVDPGGRWPQLHLGHCLGYGEWGPLYWSQRGAQMSQRCGYRSSRRGRQSLTCTAHPLPQQVPQTPRQLLPGWRSWGRAPPKRAKAAASSAFSKQVTSAGTESHLAALHSPCCLHSPSSPQLETLALSKQWAFCNKQPSHFRRKLILGSPWGANPESPKVMLRWGKREEEE